MGKDTAEAGSVMLNVDEVRQILRDEEESACQSRTVWLTTSQMGWSIHAEEDEVVSRTDIEENRLTKRCIAPMISSFIRDRWIDGARQCHRLRPWDKHGSSNKTGEKRETVSKR